MIEQLIKENTEAMRELATALREFGAVSAAPRIGTVITTPTTSVSHIADARLSSAFISTTTPEQRSAIPLVPETVAQPSQPKTRAQVQSTMIELCKTPEGKETARKALQAVGKARFSEVADDQLDVFVGHLSA